MSDEVPIPPVDADETAIELPSQPMLLAPVRAFVTTLAARCGFDDVAGYHIALAIDEALANVINHGYARRPDGRIRLVLRRLCGERPGLRITIEDEGRQVDPSEIRSRELDDLRPGGLGVHIIREVMDECCWEPRPEGGMRLTLVKHVCVEGCGDAAGGCDCDDPADASPADGTIGFQRDCP